MTDLTRLFWVLKFALLLVFVPVVSAPVLAQAPPSPGSRTISNVATMEWDDGDQRLTLASNRIDVAVEGIPTPLSLIAYRFADNSASHRFAVPTPLCTTASGAQAAVLAPAWAAQSLAPATALVISEIRSGEPFIFRVNSRANNLNSESIDTLEVSIGAASGDLELLTVFESGPDTGEFSGFLQTSRTPPPGEERDCRLAVEAGDLIEIASLAPDHRTATARTELRVLADPFGYVFDSADGMVLDGVRVTLVDVANGQPAEVFGDDGASRYPSTVATGSTVTDSGGTSYSLAPGQFRFPLAVAGTYRLVVEPPDGYFAPSVRSPADLATLRQPNGLPFAIDPQGSYGGNFVLSGPEPVQISLPLDRPGATIVLTKQVSSAVAEPGSRLRYRITVRNPDARRPTGVITVVDALPASFRLQPDTVRIDGQPATIERNPSGRGFRLVIPPLAARGTATVAYAVDVRPDARPGDAVNRAEASDDRGNRSNTADAAVRIMRDTIAGRMTIIGRVIDGGCEAGESAPGVAGVRIMLEDGSYAVTDTDGRYHFEGVLPGTHVVQLDDTTLPADRAAVDCARDTRSAGRAFSRFVDGRGGALKRVDFSVAPSAPRTMAPNVPTMRAAPMSDATAAGAERDWLAGEAPGIGWLFPGAEHNPRAPLVRVAIKHLPGQSVQLFAAGRPVDPVAFEGSRTDGDGTVAVSVWRGIPIEGRSTTLTAEVRDKNGALVEMLRRTVRYGSAPVHAELLPDRSILIADGVTRPVLAIRLTDRDGRPVRHGVTGDFELPAPYYPAIEADAQQARQLAGLERARPFWRIEGEDGIAYVELEPTTASGSVSMRFKFRDGRTEREQRLETWLEPGQRPWTIVGLAEGTVGFNQLQGKVEALGRDHDKVLTDGRVALYAKGRVRGKWLMTLAFDSDKEQDDTRFSGVIDPDAYYTVYADQSERRYDAASLRRLYLRLERPQFYALFGDYETGIDEPELARYVRAFNGMKAEYRSDRLAAVAFAADSPSRHRRDEMQGNGLSGPYFLGARGILANSERIAIEVRDSLRSDMVLERRLLSRHIDYDIDYLAGTLRFREPILSRNLGLNPQFIVADYETDGIAGRKLNAGGRLAWRTADDTLQVAATAIRDADDTRKTALIGADLRYRPTDSTEIRAEAALSDSSGGAPGSSTTTAWQVEAEHHDGMVDVLAYVRQRDGGFGIGQTTAAEDDTRKIGFDASARITDRWTMMASAWHDDYLGSIARRIAARALAEYRGTSYSGRAGVTFAEDRLADGREAGSTTFQIGATKRLFDNRLELDAQTEVPFGDSESIDFPARHRMAARFAATSAIALVGAYEIADGETVDARTARVGFDLQPWAGARIALSGNLQNIADYGPRTFAAFGLSQSLVLDEHWSVDVTFDSNKTLGGIDPTRVLNPLHPVASGGFIGGGDLTEDFTAATTGATYRHGKWSVTGRAEYRNGDRDDRYGATVAALKQIGEGSALGASFEWFRAMANGGAEIRATSVQLSWAHRPSDSRLSWLEKLELREDYASGAIAGQATPVGGGSFAITGNAQSRRLVNSLSVNLSESRLGHARYGISLFWGSRYASERLGSDDIKGWSNALGADIRFDLAETIDIGVAATVRHGAAGRALSWSMGPSVGFTPVENSWISVGWNLTGFHDRDFEEARYARSGPYLQMRFKFDQLSFQELGMFR
ncbi:MAG TPA: hypothetical protein VEB68_01675 [Croceibacterium sp.]|nr:hypothetical protein [Croceibacterium sp.]